MPGTGSYQNNKFNITMRTTSTRTSTKSAKISTKDFPLLYSQSDLTITGQFDATFAFPGVPEKYTDSSVAKGGRGGAPQSSPEISFVILSNLLRKCIGGGG